VLVERSLAANRPPIASIDGGRYRAGQLFETLAEDVSKSFGLWSDHAEHEPTRHTTRKWRTG
jgi:hypothetical protein